eukprot:TRINITY_DN2096_c0_g1_i14.p1 TRINITY_DN2096_c0_g1~~TRINITY_DN2096_c0_g1_i14.p1  ORF type:complete len:101 (+),score=5.74 TRINITY_DN2096_c0_g1_i14:202-504(+)
MNSRIFNSFFKRGSVPFFGKSSSSFQKALKKASFGTMQRRAVFTESSLCYKMQSTSSSHGLVNLMNSIGISEELLQEIIDDDDGTAVNCKSLTNRGGTKT